MTDAVLDASALIALLRNEPGADKVAAALGRCTLSSVNLAETYCKLVRYGTPLDAAEYQVNRLQIPIIPFDGSQAMLAASFHQRTREHGLSLADCVCLALGMVRRSVVLTADRKWATLSLDLEIVQIR